MTERVSIVGARNHPNLDEVRAYVRELPDDCVVISGGADGVDYTAETAAIERGLDVISYRIDGAPGALSVVRWFWHRGNERWEKAGGCRLPSHVSYRDALIFRNTPLILDSTRVAAFVAGSRGGSWDSVAQAKRFRKPVITFK